MARVHRTDFAGAIRGVEETSTGGLRIPAAVTRAGVLHYRDGEGREWCEYRPPEEVFDPDSLATLRACPVTDLHPGGLVTADSWESLAKGHVDAPPSRDEDFVVTELAVQAAPLCALVKSGERKECSSGYTCDVEDTPGTAPSGETYDRVQRRIRYNHVALGPVGWGRAGGDVALRMDGAATQVLAGAPAAEGKAMKRKLKIGGREYRLDADDPKESEKLGDEAQGAVSEMEKKKDEEIAGHAEKSAEVSAELKATKDALMTALQTVAKLEAKIAAEEAAEDKPAEVTEEDVPEAVQDSIVAKRGALLADARKVLGAEVKLDGLKAAEIRRKVVEKAHPEMRLDGLSADTVDGMFRLAVAVQAKREERVDQLGKVLAPSITQGDDVRREDGDGEDPAAGLQKRLVDLGKAPLTKKAS